jgi:nucleoid DNA-binding protein
VTKKEIVKQIADRIGETQLKTKEIVQRTFDAIVETLLEDGRIELRNFGVFEVKQRKARKARNPRTGDKVDVPPKNVVTFKPGKIMEERVRKLKRIPTPPTIHREEPDDLHSDSDNGAEGIDEPMVATIPMSGGTATATVAPPAGAKSKRMPPRQRKTT